MSTINPTPKVRAIGNESGKPMLFAVFGKCWISEDQIKRLCGSEPNTVCDFGSNFDGVTKKKLAAHDGEKVIFSVEGEIVTTINKSTVDFIASLFEKDARIADAEESKALLTALRNSK